MAITTLDGLLAGMTQPKHFLKASTGTLSLGRAASSFYMGGMPGAAVAPSPGITGEVLTSYSGQLPFSNPGSGNSYLTEFVAHAPNNTGLLLLCDRLWQNSGITITSTSEQTFTSSVQIPARDINGTNNGVGVYGAVEVSSATGAGTPTLTLKYTNSGGATNKTATNIAATIASSPIGTFYQIGLAAGDVGIQKAQSLTLSGTWTSGTIHVVLYRVIAALEVNASGNKIDILSGAFNRMYDNTVPFLVFVPTASTVVGMQGSYTVAQG